MTAFNQKIDRCLKALLRVWRSGLERQTFFFFLKDAPLLRRSPPRLTAGSRSHGHLVRVSKCWERSKEDKAVPGFRQCLHIASVAKLSTSANCSRARSGKAVCSRCTVCSTWSGSSSTDTQQRPRDKAASAVVPLPPHPLYTQSPTKK